jgi:hypothetical protein
VEPAGAEVDVHFGERAPFQLAGTDTVHSFPFGKINILLSKHD